jgi:hypothetical protein
MDARAGASPAVATRSERLSFSPPLPTHDLPAVRSVPEYSRAHPAAFDTALSEIGFDALFERRPRQMA